MTRNRSEYEVCGVLAGAYRGKALEERALLTHAVAGDEPKTLCRRVPAENMAFGSGAGPGTPPTCPACLARWLKMELP